MATRSTSRTEIITDIMRQSQGFSWKHLHYFARRIQPFGLTVPQYWSLIFLTHEEHAVTMTEISDALHMPPSSITGIVDRLERLGLVTRQPHPTDRRAILVGLTEEGEATVRRIEALRIDDQEAILAGISDEGLLQFLETVIAIEEGLDRLVARSTVAPGVLDEVAPA